MAETLIPRTYEDRRNAEKTCNKQRIIHEEYDFVPLAVLVDGDTFVYEIEIRAKRDMGKVLGYLT
jgi:hypothetical protein